MEANVLAAFRAPSPPLQTCAVPESCPGASSTPRGASLAAFFRPGQKNHERPSLPDRNVSEPPLRDGNDHLLVAISELVVDNEGIQRPQFPRGECLQHDQWHDVRFFVHEMRALCRLQILQFRNESSVVALESKNVFYEFLDVVVVVSGQNVLGDLFVRIVGFQTRLQYRDEELVFHPRVQIENFLPFLEILRDVLSLFALHPDVGQVVVSKGVVNADIIVHDGILFFLLLSVASDFHFFVIIGRFEAVKSIEGLFFLLLFSIITPLRFNSYCFWLCTFTFFFLSPLQFVLSLVVTRGTAEDFFF
eukprot:CAMPEP_0172360432 /NCGR_PEP_ID=MMETSP1060-20121228/4449_1 /TAXON_ID=37318 /ORGANISM="Pseudo-nitzschia pungens, Strain cf. cingulata" /LENGTH=304 /DNA_ID=CAMNT_0013082415 /DNA_START=562 /DNA_END=1477 /DNA_ORIENTATION=-